MKKGLYSTCIQLEADQSADHSKGKNIRKMTRTAKVFFNSCAAHSPVKLNIETKFSYFLFLTLMVLDWNRGSTSSDASRLIHEIYLFSPFRIT